MNKIFKIVFNSARGKMMVVNEATSSVQTGKKAAVTVAVIGALASGVALADAIPTDPVVVTSGSGYNAENRVLSLSGDGSDTLAIQLDGQSVQALRSYAGEFSISNINKLSITGYSANQNAIHVQAPTNPYYSYEGQMSITDVDVVEIGTTENPLNAVTAINVMGGSLTIKATKVSVNTVRGNAIVSQQASDTYPASVYVKADDINLKTASNTVYAAIFGDATDASKNASSLILDANKLSIITTGEGKAAVKVHDQYKGSVQTGETAVQLIGKTSVDIQGTDAGILIYRQTAEQGASSGLTVSSEGVINISADTDAVRITTENDQATLSADFKAPTINFDGDVTMDGSLSKLGLEGTATINGEVSASESTVDIEGETIFNGNADIGKLTGENAKLTLGNAESTVKVADNDATNTTLGATGDVNDALGGSVDALLAQFEGEAKSEGVAIAMAEGMTTGATTATIGADGKASDVVVKTNSIMSNTLDLASAAPLAMNRLLMNDVRKRMGDLRAAEGTHGVWARYDGGKLSGANGLENDFTTVQVGIDTVPVADAPRFGVAFAYTQSDADMKRGGAEMDAFSLAFYGTKFYDNGMFVDVIGRMATADTDVVVDGDKTGSMDNVALSLSGEFGWRFDVNNQFYVEPQAELTYTYVNADKLDLSGSVYEFDSVDSLLGRVGFAAGFKCPSNFGDVYVRASVVHEFLGDTTVRGGSAIHAVDGKDTWVEYCIGANFNVNKNTYVYADIERTEGAALEEDWRANVGVRFAF